MFIFGGLGEKGVCTNDMFCFDLKPSVVKRLEAEMQTKVKEVEDIARKMESYGEIAHKAME